MPSAVDCLAALMIETDWRRERGLATPPAAVRLVADDIGDADAAGDRDRLRVLWQELPAMLDEASDYIGQRGCLPV
ncbi:MAG: hypothetical protein VKI42_06705 [Synechococcaceae cyanobacterium]|nr:hypothetical protein [Synechococcaceae cyanobacterium]